MSFLFHMPLFGYAPLRVSCCKLCNETSCQRWPSCVGLHCSNGRWCL